MPRSAYRSRRHVHFTREGWYFIFVLAFIVFGSILRQINLLIVLASMMIPALLFNWRIAIGALRRLRIRHRCPEWIFAGQSTMLEIEVRNGSTLIDVWNLSLVDEIAELDGQTEPRRPKLAELVVPSIPRLRTSDASYRALFPSRGRYRIGPTTLHCRFPFGLVAAHVRHFDSAEMYVAPRLGRLSPNWHKRLGSLAVGTSSAERKRGLLPDEYYGIRPWTSGDMQRWIHWRSTAKRQDLMVKQFDQPTDRDFALALDLYSDGSPSGNDHAETALSFAATLLSKLNLSVRGRVAIAICGSDSFVYVNEIAGDFLRSVMQHLAIAAPAPRPDLAYQLPALAKRVSLGTPLIVVTTRPAAEIETLRVLWRDDSRFQVLDQVLWVQIPSAEFSGLFTPSPGLDVEEMPTDQPSLLATHLDD